MSCQDYLEFLQTIEGDLQFENVTESYTFTDDPFLLSKQGIFSLAVSIFIACSCEAPTAGTKNGEWKVCLFFS